MPATATAAAAGASMSQGCTRLFSHAGRNSCRGAACCASTKRALQEMRSGRQASPGLQVGEEAVNLGVAVEARQLFAHVVGEEADFGGGDRLGVMHAVLEAVECDALGVIAHGG